MRIIEKIKPHQIYAAGDLADPHGTHKVCLDAVFEADVFHAGMDEVFHLGDDKCPRCSGRDKAELFAGEVANHLAQQNKS